MDKKRDILTNVVVIALVLALALGALVLSKALPQKQIKPNAGVLEGFEPVVTTNAPDGE